MKNAKELLLEFTAFSFKDPEKAAAMFAKDGAFEMPYLTTFGFPGRYQGREEIAGFFRFVRELYPGFQFENIKVLMQGLDPGEIESSGKMSKRKQFPPLLGFGSFDWVCDSHPSKGEDVKSARATHEAYAACMFAAAAWKSISFLSLAAS